MVIRQPTDDEIMRALCCDGGRCREEPFVMFCHRWDFVGEVTRIRNLLERCDVTTQDHHQRNDQRHNIQEEQPLCMDARPSNEEEVRPQDDLADS